MSAAPVNSALCRSIRRCGGRLRRIAERAVACGGAGLRRERVHAQRPEGPALRGQRRPMPARAPSAQVQLAHPVDPVCRAGRGSAPITRLIHLRPPFRSAAGPRCPGPLPVVIARHVTSAVPARPHRGRRASPPGPELVRAASAVVVVAQRTAGGRAVPRDDGGHVMALFPAWHAVATFARLGESRGHRVAGRATGVGAC